MTPCIYAIEAASRSKKPAQFEMSWWALGIFVAVVRVFLGQSWCPKRMGVPPHGDAGSLPCELFADTELTACGPEDERACWIAVPRDELASPPQERESGESAVHFPRDAELDSIDSLRRLIRGYLPSGPPTIE